MADPEQVKEQLETKLEGEQNLKETLQALQTAAQQAGNPRAAQQLLTPSVIESLFEADISREDDVDDDLLREVKTLFSKHNALSHIPKDEWERLAAVNPNRFERIKAEMPAQRGPGSKCVGEVRHIMTGEKDREPLTAEKSRRLDHSREVRRLMLSLGIDAKAFDGVTEIQTSVEANTSGEPSSDSSSGGRLSRITSALPGGD